MVTEHVTRMLGVGFAAFAACLASGHGFTGGGADVRLLTAERQTVLRDESDERTLNASVRLLGCNLDADVVLFGHN